MDILFENVVPIFYSKIQHYSLLFLVDNGNSIIFKVWVVIQFGNYHLLALKTFLLNTSHSTDMVLATEYRDKDSVPHLN